MKVDIEDISSCKKLLKIEIPSEDVNAELEKAYEEIRKKAEIRGFRKGKTPRNVIKMRFKDYIKSEVIDNLVPPAFKKVVEDAELELLRPPNTAENMKPSFDEMSVNENDPISFEITVDVKPEITVPDLAQLEVEKGNVNVSKEDVDAYLELLVDDRAEFTPVEDRPVQKGDYVKVDISAESGDEMLIDENEQTFEIGGNSIAEVVEHILGMNPDDEKDFTISFPEGHRSENMAGKEVNFHVKLIKIMEKRLPALDDDFAKDLGEDDLERLIAKVWNQLIDDAKEAQRSKQQEDLIAQLLEKSEFEVPEFMIKERAGIEMRADMIKVGRSVPQAVESEPDEQELEKYRSSATDDIRTLWLLDIIAESEEVEVSDEEIDVGIRELAQIVGRDPVKYRKLMEDTNRIDRLRASIWERKVFDAMIEKAAIKRSLIT